MNDKKPRVVRKVKVEGKWVFALVASVGGRLDFAHVVYREKKIRVDGGTFYLDFREAGGRRRMAIEGGPDDVKRALQTQAHVLHLRKQGVDVDDAPELQGARRGEGISLAAFALEYKNNPPARLGAKSVKKYKNAVLTFSAWAQRSAKLTHVSQVDRRTINAWMNHLKDVEGLEGSTIADKVTIVLSELGREGNKIKFQKKDLPKRIEREVEEYEPQDLQQIFALMDEDEYALYKTFLMSGMRDAELGHMCVEDIFESKCALRVSAKPEIGFTPKNYQERMIAVHKSCITMLQKYMKRNSITKGIVFRTSDQWAYAGHSGGQRDKNMLLKLKRIALRGGLNCGQCKGTWRQRRVTCATHPICKRFGLHKFRHTYACTHLRDGMDIVTLQGQMGHKDLDSTRKYLRALRPEMLTKQVRSSSLAKKFG